ncbi:hypothetical protein [Bacillus kexueae]|uniref:hypothetical protein n=1 Tax=Aeribacillus kexueae TaxID=2078952 RepID=UPI001FAEC4C7|nr:hypothetical protein [Bacillus kexueae]
MIKKLLKSIVKQKLYSHHYKKYHSSSYDPYRSRHPKHYGHHFYKRKHKSSGFFSSFYSS